MITKFIEATNGGINWGKFVVCRFDGAEWHRESAVSEGERLVRSQGWSFEHLFVLDLSTGEGAMFRHGGFAPADLQKHLIWVCPLFEPFLAWLYKQDVSDLEKLPAHVDLPDAPAGYHGYRRPGPPP